MKLANNYLKNIVKEKKKDTSRKFILTEPTFLLKCGSAS